MCDVDDAGLEDMSEDDTDTPQTSSPSTPATEHMKTFPSDDNNMVRTSSSDVLFSLAHGSEIFCFFKS